MQNIAGYGVNPIGSCDNGPGANLLQTKENAAHARTVLFSWPCTKSTLTYSDSTSSNVFPMSFNFNFPLQEFRDLPPRNSSTDLATKKGIKIIPEVVAMTEAIFAWGFPGYLGHSIDELYSKVARCNTKIWKCWEIKNEQAYCTTKQYNSKKKCLQKQLTSTSLCLTTLHPVLKQQWRFERLRRYQGWIAAGKNIHHVNQCIFKAAFLDWWGWHCYGLRCSVRRRIAWQKYLVGGFNPFEKY